MKKALAFLAVITMILTVGCTEHHETLPPGYNLICNENGEYKWKSNTRTLSYGTSKQNAIDYAWDEYTYKNCPLKEE